MDGRRKPTARDRGTYLMKCLSLPNTYTSLHTFMMEAWTKQSKSLYLITTLLFMNAAFIRSCRCSIICNIPQAQPNEKLICQTDWFLLCRLVVWTTATCTCKSFCCAFNRSSADAIAINYLPLGLTRKLDEKSKAEHLLGGNPILMFVVCVFIDSPPCLVCGPIAEDCMGFIHKRWDVSLSLFIDW